LVRAEDSWHTPDVPKTNYFDDTVAESYDETSADMFASDVLDPAVRFLADLAGAPGGEPAALEFGIGTGRIALPLSRKGVRVHGIDLSPEMVSRLQTKPGAGEIGVTVGDFATTRVDGTFRLVYLVWNTIMNLTTQDEQVACFQNAAAHLEPGGCFVVEVMTPQLQRLPPGETVQPFHVSATRLGFDKYDIASQSLVSHHYWIDGDHARVMSIPFRYVWPAELDLMARLAGMRLRGRWSGWKGESFTSDSATQVSVWEKTAER
jgi:SAM-dependent methyltransferase